MISTTEINQIIAWNSLEAVPCDDFRIYSSSRPGSWKTLKASFSYERADTVSDFESFCLNPDISTIFVSKDCFGPQIAERIMKRLSADKTVIMEID